MNRASKETINHTKHTYRTIVFPLVDNESFKAIHKPRNVLQPHKINWNRSETTKQEVSELGSSFLIHQRKCILPLKFTLGDLVLAVSYRSPLYTSLFSCPYQNSRIDIFSLLSHNRSDLVYFHYSRDHEHIDIL